MLIPKKNIIHVTHALYVFTCHFSATVLSKCVVLNKYDNSNIEKFIYYLVLALLQEVLHI